MLGYLRNYIEILKMTEQQQEIFTENSTCFRCGNELTKSDFSSINENTCRKCDNIISRLDDDFNMTKSLLNSIIYGSVGKAELKVLDRIISDYIPFDASKSFSINQTEFAKKHKLQQSNVSRTIKKLLESKLLIKNENGTFMLKIGKF